MAEIYVVETHWLGAGEGWVAEIYVVFRPLILLLPLDVGCCLDLQLLQQGAHRQPGRR